MVDLRRTDTWVARAVWTFCIATMVLTSWIGFRTWGAVERVVLHPMTLTQTQALVVGLWSSNLMVLQVLFMARLPWLERAWGRRVLAHRHRLLGYWSFWLMVAHVLLFTLQRYLREPDNTASTMSRLFLTDPWMLVATIGTVLIVLVVATSIAPTMRALRYETWHLIHLNAYLGMGLALPHQLISVDFTQTWIAAYWWTLFVGALAVIVAFRVAAPILRTRRHAIRVIRVEPETTNAVTVTMSARDLDGLGAQAGQYLVWRFLGSPGRTHGHPYSLSAAPRDGRLRITADTGGDGGGRRRGATGLARPGHVGRGRGTVRLTRLDPPAARTRHDVRRRDRGHSAARAPRPGCAEPRGHAGLSRQRERPPAVRRRARRLRR